MSLSTNTELLTQLGQVLATKAAGSGGTDLPTLQNPGDADKLLEGYQLIGQTGQAITGTIPSKSGTDLTASGAAVTVPAGYYPAQVSKSVATATQATPTITVDSVGKITASATQTAGYVAAGTKTAAKQMTVQAAKTWTPGTSNQTLASGRYLTGAQTIKGDAQLKAANIVKGVSIFGVTGTAEAGSSGDDTLEQCAVGFDIQYTSVCVIYYETINNGEVAVNVLSDSNISGPFTIESIPKGSTIMIYCPNNSGDSHEGNIAILGNSSDYAMLLYQANGDGSITIQ